MPLTCYLAVISSLVIYVPHASSVSLVIYIYYPSRLEVASLPIAPSAPSVVLITLIASRHMCLF